MVYIYNIYIYKIEMKQIPTALKQFLPTFFTAKKKTVYHEKIPQVSETAPLDVPQWQKTDSADDLVSTTKMPGENQERIDLELFHAVTFRCFFPQNLLLKVFFLKIRTENVHGTGTLWKRLVVNGG